MRERERERERERDQQVLKTERTPLEREFKLGSPARTTHRLMVLA